MDTLKLNNEIEEISIDDEENSIEVVKRNGTIEEFDSDKVSNSIMQAAMTVGGEDADMADDLASQLEDYLLSNGVERIFADDIDRMVKKLLVDEGHALTAEAYILKSEDKKKHREMDSALMKEYEEISFTSPEDSEVKRENANIDSSTSMGTMLKYGSEGAKKFNLLYVASEDIAKAHINGDIHIHDLDFALLTETCTQIPLDKLFNDGFNTGHGFLREPGGIRAAGALAAIAIQSNQNDQHGGQSIPMFDWYLAPYVSLTYVKNIAKITDFVFDLSDKPFSDDGVYEELKSLLIEFRENSDRNIVMNTSGINTLRNIVTSFISRYGIEYTDKQINKIFKHAYKKTYNETYQSMEAFIHNLNTMHSRAGAQVPFSSINYGTDTSTEGRMVMECLLKTTWAGLGNGETPIFPIQIWKLKDGVSVHAGDTNYDLFQLACKVSCRRLYPNFVNCDATYNKAIYVEGHPETEIATMGCRTRVATNVYKPENQVIPGRGNLSFTSINLPRIAILAKHDINKFYKLLDDRLDLVHRQLLERFRIQCQKHPRNYPFLMGQGVWIDSEKLGPDDDITDVLKNGTLAVGFIGLAETLTALIGHHHGESEKAQELGLEIIKHMREATNKWSEEEKMNYGIIGTPAEGLSGRFVRMDRERFGTIHGVTDKDYYTNSSHVPVNFKISATRKVDIEAPYHEIENGGHILYIEMDGDPTKNVKAFEKIVHYMYEKNAGYFAVNHPVDRDPVCGYVGIIGDKCPRCGRREGEAMTQEMWDKIHGYANVGNADTLGYHAGSFEEEANRIPQTL